MEACIINILQCHDPFCCSMNHVNELEQTIIIEQLQWRLFFNQSAPTGSQLPGVDHFPGG